MTAILLIGLFLLGAAAASFAGVLAGRLYTGQGIVQGRSRCDACGRELAPRALVPVASWLLACGRSRCCGARISWAAPASELLLGALFVLVYLSLGATPAFVAFALALTLLAALVLYDLAHQILPPPLLVAFVFAAGVAGWLTASTWAAFEPTLILALVLALFFFALWGLSLGRAMGLADAPLALGLALLVGAHAALAGFLLSFWIGAGVGILVLVRAPKGARMGIEVPFAPFLAAGFLLAYFTQWDPFSITALILGALSGV